MLIASHALVGGTIGELVDNPILALLLGIISHFVLDAIPHYDTTDDGRYTKRQLALFLFDLIIGVVLIVILLPTIHHSLSFFAGMVGGILPDFIDNVPFWNKHFQSTRFGKSFHEFHTRIQPIKLSPVPGLLVQLVFLIGTVLILVSK